MCIDYACIPSMGRSDDSAPMLKVAADRRYFYMDFLNYGHLATCAMVFQQRSVKYFHDVKSYIFGNKDIELILFVCLPNLQGPVYGNTSSLLLQNLSHLQLAQQQLAKIENIQANSVSQFTDLKEGCTVMSFCSRIIHTTKSGYFFLIIACFLVANISPFWIFFTRSSVVKGTVL